MKARLLAISLTTTALSVLGGCATTPKDSALLAQAREAVSRAESDAGVTKYAPTELDRARKLLINAEGAAKERGPVDKVTSHYAYLTTQMAHIAEQRAQEQVAMTRVKSGETERQRILLSARESEADRALAQARNAQAQAEQARNEAQNAQAQVAQTQTENQRLMGELQAAQQTSRGIVLTLGDVLFDTGKSELKPGATRPIEQIATFLNENPERRVQIEGFTDSQGTDEYNQQLSQRRADAVARAIIQRGIDSQRVRALGYGEEYPKASNDSAGSRQLNRRVEIVVSNGDAAIPERTTASP
ncbi:MAG TPA: OmpA family protein [Steroidobacteraceae bacterium]|nr:OmpA family protein [Steroidobacteraceae bacterium]